MSRTTSTTKHVAILDRALDVFLERGYLGASMDEIAAKAGVSKQTVYKHFADKDRLFAAIVLATTADVDRLVHWIVDGFGDLSDSREKLVLLAKRFLSALMEPRLLRLRRLVIANADRFPELGRSWYKEGFERVLATLADCFARLDAAGVLRVDDSASCADHFVGMLLWIPVNNAMFTGNETPYTRRQLDRIATSAVRAFLAAYGAREPDVRPAKRSSRGASIRAASPVRSG